MHCYIKGSLKHKPIIIDLCTHVHCSCAPTELSSFETDYLVSCGTAYFCSSVDEQIDRVDVDCIDIHGKTPLHYASENGHNDVVCMLISEFQAGVKCLDRYGQTPLQFACINGHSDVVRMLVSEFQANANWADRYS